MAQLIPYASRTGTRRNLDVLRQAGWRLLVSAAGAHRHEGFGYALDNGAWTAYQQGKQFDARRFDKLVSKMGTGADWIAVPDIVGGGHASLMFSESWLPRLEPVGVPLLIPVQDGLEVWDVEPLLGERTGIFIGGTTAWKLRTAHQWGRLAKRVGCYLHVGRVNSAKRIRLCQGVGAHSFDGTSVTRYAVELPKLDNARRQLSFPLEVA